MRVGMRLLEPLLERVPPRVLRTIDQWKFWVTLLVVVVGFGLVWMFVITQRLTREQATREARIEADYRSCINSIPSLKKISEHVLGVNHLAEAIAMNNAVALQHSAPADRAFRAANLARVQRARKEIAAVRGFPTPTQRSCEQQRRQLNG